MDKREARKRLEQERERLEGLKQSFEVQNTEEAERDSFSELSLADQHPADMGTETFEREKDYSIRTQVEAELGEIDKALKRVEDGTYGTCEVCGKRIPEERLKAVPWTRYCVDHQAQVERDTRIA